MRATTVRLEGEFKAFIASQPEEQAWLSEWAAIDLAAPPAPGSGK